MAIAILGARILGASEYGAYVYAIAWSNLLIAPSLLGLDRYLVRAVAMYRVQGRWDLIRGLLRRADQAVVFVGLTLAAGAACAGWWFVNQDLLAPFLLALLLPVLTALILVREGAMQGLGRVSLGLVPYLLAAPAGVVVLVVSSKITGVIHITATTMMACTVVATLVALSLAGILRRRALPPDARREHPTYQTRTWTHQTLPLVVIAAILMAGNQIVVIILGSINGTSSVAVYSVAARIAEALGVMLFAVNNPLAPVASSLYTLGRIEALQGITTRSVRAAFAFSLPVAVLLVAARRPLLLLFGHAFGNGQLAVVLLVAAQLVNVGAGAVGTLLIMTGFTGTAALGFGLGLVSTSAITFALAPSLGVNGAALGMMTGTIVWNVALAVLTWRRLGINATILARGTARTEVSGKPRMAQ